jgi:23S rRNA (uracil1939-C5)-methyltransferase
MHTTELRIHDVAFGGKGVGRHNGKAIFVPFTIDGETISAEIVREKKQFAEAEVVEIREASPHRVTPPCPYFGRCGGCAYQHIDYEHQLGIKWRQVRDVLQRIGKISEPPMRPIIASPQPYGYRSRITVHAQDGVIGFFRRESNHLIDIQECPISSDEVNRELRQLRERKPPDGHYSVRANAGPRIFSQINDAVAGALRQLVVGMIPAKQDLLIDAHCGAGFFAKALLGKFEKVIGIDWDRFAIEEARKSATAKEAYIAGDVDEELLKVAAVHRTATPEAATPSAVDSPYSWRLGSIAATTIIIDPPAAGLSANTRNAIIDLAPGTLIYVSCNPATLARDVKALMPRYRIDSITPLDMFPQTAEIEVAVHLQA